jgi:hypothetical protein
MRGLLAAVATLMILAGCTGGPSPSPTPPRTQANEFEGSGQIHGSFSLGDQSLQDGWVEMIELSSPAGEGCGPGDCGLAVEALRRGVHWNPGRWLVVPPDVPSWGRPASFVIVVKAGQLTTVHASYESP